VSRENQLRAMNWIRDRAKTDDRVDEFIDTYGKLIYVAELLEAYREDIHVDSEDAV
jgi:hypothetical protein